MTPPFFYTASNSPNRFDDGRASRVTTQATYLAGGYEDKAPKASLGTARWNRGCRNDEEEFDGAVILLSATAVNSGQA